MNRRVNITLFGGQRSRLRLLPGLQRWLRRIYLQQRSWALKVDDDLILCRILGKFKFFADPLDHSISPHLVMDGYWEPRTTATIIDLLSPGMVAIDVGANLGYFTVLMASLVGTDGRVIAFEPNPRMAERLRATLMLSGFEPRVDFHQDVLGETNGEQVQFQISTNHPGGSRVGSVQFAEKASITLQTRQLDTVPGALEAALVKIDAEGMEEAIWNGMTAMIKGSSLRYVIIEFSPSCYHDAAGMLDRAEAAGFTISCISDDRGVRAITRAEIFDGVPQRMLLLQR
jgi:FkbM family methyltransferase